MSTVGVDLAPGLGVVVIGRNESRRLGPALASVLAQCPRVVYVDSGSTDDSVTIARSFDVDVVELDDSRPHTAARGRNAGFAALTRAHPDVRWVQFVDGDCEIEPGWLTEVLRLGDVEDPPVAVSGPGREVDPASSIYNRMADVEWRRSQPGEVTAFSGRVALRADAFAAAGGFDESLIAGEEDDLCVRLRSAGGRIVCSAHPSFVHDAAMRSVRQWWRRSQRTGYAYALVGARHGRGPFRLYREERRRTVLWGLVVPVVAIVAAPRTRGLSLLVPVARGVAVRWKVARELRGMGFSAEDATAWGTHCALAPVPEAVGVLRYLTRRLRGQAHTLIEYQVPRPEQPSS